MAWGVPESGTPANFSVLDNIAIANQILFAADYFESSSYGEVKASIATQRVYGKRKVKSGNVFTQSISVSSFVELADQQYISGNTYLYRNGSNIKNDTATFGDVKEMSPDGYLQKYGIPPRELCKYVINETTVLDAVVESFPANGDGEYVFRLTLDPTAASEYYANEVRTRSGASSNYPQFKSIVLTVTMDSNWIVSQYSVNEEYTIDKPLKVTCYSTLTETFSNINADLDVPEAEPFLQYVPSGSGSEEEEQPDNPILFLGSAFGPYLGGEPLYLDASIKVPSYKLDLQLKADIDLATMRFDFLLDDSLYIGYRQILTDTGTTDAEGNPVLADDSLVYLRAGGLCGYMPVDAFTAILPDLLQALPDISPALADFDLNKLTESFGDVSKLLSGAELVKGDEVSTVKLPIQLDGVTLNAEINAYNEGGMHSITAYAGLFKLGADINVYPCEKPAMPDTTGYADLSPVLDVLPALARTLGGKAFAFGIDGSVGYGENTYGIDGQLQFNRDALSVGGTLTAEIAGVQLPLSVVYAGDTLYATVANTTVKASAAEFMAAVQKFTGLQELPAIDLSDLDLAKILNAIRSVQTADGVLTLETDVATVHISYGETVTGIRVVTPSLNGVTADVNVTVACTEPVAVTIPQAAVSLSDALDIYDAILPVIAADGYTITGNLQTDLLSDVSPSYTLRLDKSLAFALDVQLGAQTATVTRTADGAIYLEVGTFGAVLQPTAITGAGLELPAALTDMLPEELISILTDTGLPSLLSNDYGLLQYLEQPTVANGRLSAVFNTGKLLVTADVDYADGLDAGITLAVGTHTVTVTGALTAGAVTIGTPAGTFIDLTAAVPFVKPILSTVQAKNFAFSVRGDITYGSFSDTLTGSAWLNVPAKKAEGGLAAAATLSSNSGATADLTYCDNAVYVGIGAITARATADDLKRLIPLPASFTPDTVLDMLAMIREVSGKGNTLSVKTDIGTLRLQTGNGLATGISLQTGEQVINETAFAVQATVDITTLAAPTPITAPAATVDVSDALALYDTVLAMAQAEGFAIDGQAAFTYDGIADTIEYSLLLNRDLTFSLDFRVKQMGFAGSVVKTGGKTYIRIGDFRFAVGNGQNTDEKSAAALPSVLTDLLPDEALYLIQNGLSDLGNAVKNIFRLVDYVQEVSLQNGALTVRVDTGKISLTVHADTADGIPSAADVTLSTRLNGVAVNVSADGTLQAGSKQEIAVPDGKYADLNEKNIGRLIADLLDGKTVSTLIYLKADTVTEDGEEIEIETNGELRLSVVDGKAAFAVTFVVFDTPVEIRLSGGVFYLRAGELMLKLDTADKQALFDALDETLPGFVRDFVEKLLSFDVNGLLEGFGVTVGGSSLSIDDILKGLRVTDGKLHLSLDTNALGLTVGVSVPKDGTVSGADLLLQMSGTTLTVALTAPTITNCASLDTSAGPLYEPTDRKDEYIDLMEFVAYFDAISAAVKADSYELTTAEDLVVYAPAKTYCVNEGMKVGDAAVFVDGKAQSIKTVRPIVVKKGGVIRLVPQGKLGESGYFLNVYLSLTLEYTEEVVGVGNKIAARQVVQPISATLIDEPVADGKTEKVLYVEYGETKVKIKFNQVLGMLAYIRDILDIHGTILDDIPTDLYDANLDTSIFGSMDGFDKMRDSVINMLQKAENLFDLLLGYEADEAAGKPAYEGVLQSVESIGKAKDLVALKKILNEMSDAITASGLVKQDETSGNTVATVAKVIKTVTAVQLRFTESARDVDGVYVTDKLMTVVIPSKTEKDAAMTFALALSDGKLEKVHIGNFAAEDVTVTATVGVKTGKILVQSPTGNSQTYDNNAITDDKGNVLERKYYNDFSTVGELFKDLINTANLKAFYIGGANNTEKGTIQLLIPELLSFSSSIGVKIPFIVKVEMVEPTPGVYKPLVYVRLEVPSFVGVVEECTSQLYFYENEFLFTRTMGKAQTQTSTPDWNDTTHWTKTEYVRATTQTLLLKDAQGNLDIGHLMKFVYFMIPLSNIVQNQINNAISKGITNDFAEPTQTLNYYGYQSENYKLGLDVAAISRISEINDANVSIITKRAADGVNYIDNLQADITFLYGTTGIGQGIKLTVDGYLVNPGQKVGTISYYDPTRPNNSCPAELNGNLFSGIDTHYHRDGVFSDDISIIPDMIAKIRPGNNISGEGTIDSPYSQWSCNSKG